MKGLGHLQNNLTISQDQTQLQIIYDLVNIFVSLQMSSDIKYQNIVNKITTLQRYLKCRSDLLV